MEATNSYPGAASAGNPQLDALMPKHHAQTLPPNRAQGQTLDGFHNTINVGRQGRDGIDPTQGEWIGASKMTTNPATGQPQARFTHMDFQEGKSSTIDPKDVAGADHLTHSHPDGVRYASFGDYKVANTVYLDNKTESLFTSGKNDFQIAPDKFEFNRLGNSPTPPPSPTHPLSDSNPWGTTGE